jgi:hypothetical protein
MPDKPAKKSHITKRRKLTNTFYKTVFEFLGDEDIVAANTDPIKFTVPAPLTCPHIAKSS